MKTIRTAGGIRRIEDSGDHITIFKIREILSEHRKTLISRITADPNAYLEYKFQKRLSGKGLAALLDSLVQLANSPVDLDRYDSILNDFHHQQHLVLSNSLFYQEIDEHIYEAMNPSQLRLTVTEGRRSM